MNSTTIDLAGEPHTIADDDYSNRLDYCLVKQGWFQRRNMSPMRTSPANSPWQNIPIGDLPPKNRLIMTVINIGTYSYFGDEATLVSGDRYGLRVFESALRTAQEAGKSTFNSGDIVNQVVRQKDAADIEFSQQAIVWRFDDEKLGELIALTESLIVAESAAHQYIDINSPTSTLVIAIGEHA